MSDFDMSDGRAPQSCIACKKLKRKCDKLAPSCSLCQRTGRRCEYTASEVAPTAGDLARLHARIAELEQNIHQSERYALSPYPTPSQVSGAPTSSTEPQPHLAAPTDPRLASSTVSHQVTSAVPHQAAGIETGLKFPNALFLDIDCYKWAELHLPHVPVAIPMDVLTILSHDNALMDISKAYFESVHTWFPLVSRKRMNTGSALLNGGPDLALLFFTMKLVTSDFEFATAGESSLYSTAKAFLAKLEASGLISFLCLQGMVFIALFEFSHAIYPAAWMTIGACARYAEMLGLTTGTDTMGVMSKMTSWMEVEERRRLAWAIFVLDRISSLGSKRRFAVAAPPTGILPANEAAWEHGNIAQAIAITPANPHRLPVPAFGQLCQAALLIDRAAACQKTYAQDSRLAEIEELVGNILSFQANVKAKCSQSIEGIKVLPSYCLSVSALYFILDNYTCPEKLANQPGYQLTGEAKDPAEHAMQLRAMELIQQASKDVHSVLQDMLRLVDQPQTFDSHISLDMISPMSFDAIYCAIATLHWNAREGSGDMDLRRLHEMNFGLETLAQRWRLAREYSNLGSYHDYVHGLA